MLKNKKISGYTLIEAVIYLAILAVIITAVIGLTVSMIRALSEVRISQALTSSAQSSLELITRQIRGADEIVIASSVFGVNPSRLFINSFDEMGVPVTYDFYISQAKILLSTNGGPGVSLLTESVTVDSFVIHHFTGVNVEGVKIELIISDSRNSIRNRSFSATAIRR